MENKENINKNMNNQVDDFLSCAEIFSVTEVKSAIIIHQNYPKILQVKASIDKILTDDDRVLPNLIANEERYLPGNPDYFRFIQDDVKPHMRKIVADWMLEVCQEMGCLPPVFCLAVNYMDRFLSTCRIQKNHLQLLGAVCLFLASKFKETVAIPSEKLVMYTDFSVSLAQLKDWELGVLRKLQWDLSSITAIDYLDFVLPNLPSTMEDITSLRCHVETIIALCYTNYNFSYTKPSVIASAAIAVAVRSLVPQLSIERANEFLDSLQSMTLVDTSDLELCSNAIIQHLPAYLTTHSSQDDIQQTIEDQVNSENNSNTLNNNDSITSDSFCTLMVQTC